MVELKLVTVEVVVTVVCEVWDATLVNSSIRRSYKMV